MRHLSPHVLIDLLDGVRAEADEPHLTECAFCRDELRSLRGIAASAAHVDVPEPSPLFWDHLSARVREAVQNEPAVARPASWWELQWIRPFASAASAVAVAIVLVVMMRSSREETRPAVPEAARNAAAVVAPLENAPDDPSLRLLVDLATGLDWESADEVGLTDAGGAAERAVASLTDAERLELRRLLRAEIGESGA